MVKIEAGSVGCNTLVCIILVAISFRDLYPTEKVSLIS